MAQTPEIGDVIQLTPRCVAYVRATSGRGADEISNALCEGFAKINMALQLAGVKPIGPSMAAYHSSGETQLALDICLPINVSDAGSLVGVKTTTTLAGNALRVVHHGPHAGLVQTYAAIRAHLAENNLTLRRPTYEVYLSDFGDTADDALVTEVLVPVA